MLSRREGSARPWPLYVLALITAGVVAFAIAQIGPPSSSARTSREVVTAEKGVVQSTVSGTGNVAAGTDVTANFQTSGTIANVYVHQGQHVIQGQLMATLDPTADQLSVDQAQEQLTAAQDQLTALENGTSSSNGSSANNASSGGTATGASTTVANTTEFVSQTTTSTTPTTTTPPKKKKPTTPTTTTTTPTTTTTTRTTTTSSRSTSSGSGATAASHGSTTTTSTATTPSPASLASAQASIDSAEANLRTAQQTLAKTKLYAPATGTIVSLSTLTTGDTVSAGSTGSAGNGSSGSGSSGSGASGSGASSTAGGLGNSGSSSNSSSSSSSSSFAEIVDASAMTMTVSFSESDVTKVHVGQPATVSIDALSGVELGAHVSSIATVGTTSSGVVSYAATLTLDQIDPRVKPGMSASASVIVGQAQGVTVPTQAITGSGSLATVNLLKNGKTVTQPVEVGLRGDSRAQIVSGLSAGQQLVITVTLPSLGSSSSSSSGAGTLGGRLGGGGGLGGLGGGGGGFLFRGAGGGGRAAAGGG